MQNETLLEKTRRLLDEAPRHVEYQTMAESIGVSKSWLSMFKDGKIANPGIVTIQNLHDYLSTLKA